MTSTPATYTAAVGTAERSAAWAWWLEARKENMTDAMPAWTNDPIQRFRETLIRQIHGHIDEISVLKLEIIRLKAALQGMTESRDMWKAAYEGKFAGSSNSRTPDFDSENLGSIPSPATIKDEG